MKELLDGGRRRVQGGQLNGQYDEETASSALLSTGLTITQFRESQRRRMKIDQLQRAIGATWLVTPSDYRRYLNLVAEQRLHLR